MQRKTKYRLGDSTVVEPLVNSWLAWPYVVSPAAASLHLLHYQIEVLRSYLEDPAFHVKASRDPKLMGGPFVNIPETRAAEVKELLDVTEQRQSANIKLAKSITQSYNWLLDQAKGQSLDPLYGLLQEELRGYVELVYDYYNRPTIRFIEGSLYRSNYYDKSLQSMRLSCPRRDDSRPFFMSTPRLMSGGQIDWKASFDSPLVDQLFKLDVCSQSLDSLRETLGLDDEDTKRLLPMLSTEDSRPAERWNGPEIRMKYFGHACVLAEWKGAAILTDPFIAVLPPEREVSRLSYRDLPETINYAMVTHAHPDHFLLESLLRLRHRIECLVVPKCHGMLYGDVSLKLMARKAGFKTVVELDSFESISLLDAEIVAVPFLGEHGDLAHSKTGYVVRSGNHQILFGADSNCLDRGIYEEIHRVLGPIETVFLGIEPVGAPLSWSYGSLFPKKQAHAVDRSRRQRGCGCDAALSILEAVGAKRFYNYGMGQEPWLSHILALSLPEDSPQILESNNLLTKARSRGLIAERPVGKCEIFLNGASSQNRSFVQPKPDGEDAQPVAAGWLSNSAPPPAEETRDEDAHFAF